MKIEMAESLIRSWARHCVGCQLAELNWKPSSESTWPRNDVTSAATLFSDAIEFFKNVLDVEIFKKTFSVDQLIKQAEIDVLGLKIDGGRVEKIIAVDVAFHSGGLLYGGATETAGRVAKKLFRSAVVADTFFPGTLSELIFAAPKVNPASIDYLIQAEKSLNDFFSSRRENFSFRILINDDFSNEILQPVLALKGSIADTSELFLRSAQMIGLFDKKGSAVRSIKPAPKRASEADIVSHKDALVADEIKKVKRKVPMWFQKPTQINSRILSSFLRLRDRGGLVTLVELKAACRDIPRFEGNYNQMKNFGEKNNAKVFEETNGAVLLWEPVETFIIEEYERIKR